MTMPLFKVYMNAGVEWEETIDCETEEEAKSIGYQLCRDKLGDLRDYNFDCEVKEYGKDK